MALTKEKLKEVLRYVPETGVFTWDKNISRKTREGTPTGCISSSGYVLIRINKVLYRAHRLAWLYIYGEFPSKLIDHINGQRSDNRLCNLRQASNQENLRNTGKNSANSSGYKGVCWDKSRGKWLARATMNYRGVYLGYFDTAVEAATAYQTFAKKHHNEFYNIQGEI